MAAVHLLFVSQETAVQHQGEFLVAVARLRCHRERHHAKHQYCQAMEYPFHASSSLDRFNQGLAVVEVRQAYSVRCADP